MRGRDPLDRQEGQSQGDAQDPRIRGLAGARRHARAQGRVISARARSHTARFACAFCAQPLRTARITQEAAVRKVDKATNELERAQYSWSTHANLLFVDQPVGTGEAHWGGSRRSCRTDHCQYRILTALRAHPGRPKASEETHIVFAPGSHSHATPTLTTEARWWGRRLLVLHRAQGHGAL